MRHQTRIARRRARTANGRCRDIGGKFARALNLDTTIKNTYLDILAIAVVSMQYRVRDRLLDDPFRIHMRCRKAERRSRRFCSVSDERNQFKSHAIFLAIFTTVVLLKRPHMCF